MNECKSVWQQFWCITHPIHLKVYSGLILSTKYENSFYFTPSKKVLSENPIHFEWKGEKSGKEKEVEKKLSPISPVHVRPIHFTVCMVTTIFY